MSTPATAVDEPIRSLGELHRRIRRVYWNHYREFLAISLPAASLGVLVLVLSSRHADELSRTLPRGFNPRDYPATLAQAALTRFGGWFFSLFLECYALAATGALFAELNAEGREDQQLVVDAYSTVRSKIAPLLYFAFTSFLKGGAGLVGLAFIPAAATILVRRIFHHHLAISWWISLACATLAIALMVARYSLAVPRIVSEKVSAHEAIKRTVKAVQGFDTWIFVLGLEAVVTGYFSGLIAAWLATYFLEKATWVPQSWGDWITFAVAAVAAALAQPPLFIGCSLVHHEMSRSSQRRDASISSASFLPSTE